MKIGDAIFEPQSRSRVEFRSGKNGDHALIVSYAGVSKEELRRSLEMPFTIGLIENQPGIFLLFSFSIGDGYSPFSIHNQSNRTVPTGDTGSLDILLIEAETGVLVGRRRSTRSAEFFSSLNAAIRRQADQDWSPHEYNSNLAEFEHSYIVLKGDVWHNISAQLILVDTNSTNYNPN